MSSERSVICTSCLGYDPMHCEDDGWRGDCPWWLRVTKAPGHDPAGTCSYGCRDEPACQTECPGIKPDGWGPNPGGAPCWECGGIGVVPMIVDTSYPSRRVYL